MADWRYEKDGETITRTCAWSPPGCHPVGCGLRLHVKDGKLVEVEGDPEHPVTRGALCPRCLALKDYIYHPDRLIHPMRRAKEDRGKDKWVQCSWDEALDIIEAEAKRVIGEYGPNSIVVFGGTGREATMYYPVIAHCVFGSANPCYAQSGWSCYGPRLSFSTFSVGYSFPEMDTAAKFADTFDNPAWTPPECILLWGKEPLKSNGDGLWGHSVLEIMKRFGTKLIMIDPRMTWLGTRAEEVVRVRPGTDAALGMAMLNVIINEDLYDHEFVEKWCHGFEELKERINDPKKGMTPAKAAEICWVPEDQIVRVARTIATSKPCAMGWGLAVDQNPNGAQVAQTFIALNAITGNFDAPGGTMLGELNVVEGVMPANWAINEGVMSKEDYAQRIGNDTFPAVNAVLPTADPDAVLDTLESDEPYPLRMAMFQSSNVIGAAISSAPQRWYKALEEKMEFCFATDLFMNPTIMALCDVFLPLATFAEHNCMVDPYYGSTQTFRGAMNKAIEVGECKSDIEVMILLGKRMHPELWNRYETEIDYIKDKVMAPGMEWEDLQKKVTISAETPYRKYELGLLRPDREPGFPTPTGKIELCSLVFEQFGDDPLPYYMEPPFSPYSTPDLAEDFPLILTTGARTYASFHSEHRQIASLREIVPEPLFEISPADSAKLGIQEGEWCWIETPFGKCRQKANVTPCIGEGIVHAMHGWWFPEEDGEAPNLFGNWKSNVNVTMPHEVNGKLGYGDCFKNNICKVYKCED